MRHWFDKASEKVSEWLGHPLALTISVLYVIILLKLGSLHIKDAVLIISILTWWQLFPLQATQNRESKALHLKLDALLKALKENQYIGSEKESYSDLVEKKKEIESEKS